MFKPLVLYVGLRYTRAKRRTNFISFITLTSVMGIALGVTALITVLSVMNGFEAELRERILGMTSHATITGERGKLSDWQSLEKVVQENSKITGWAPYVKGQVMLSVGKRVSGAMLRGIDPALEGQVSDVTSKVVAGTADQLIAGEYGIILGSALANHLGVIPGDQVTVISPQLNSTPAGVLPRLRRFKVVGIFEIGMYEYDRNLALIQIDDAAKLLRLGEAVSGLRLKLEDLFVAPEVTRELLGKLRGRHFISDWTKTNNSFFRAIEMEKRVMFIILLLIVAVAAFNIVSTLVMVVTDKRPDIAILRTQGLTPLRVMGIFIVTGSVIGVVGTLLGLAGGITLALNVGTIVPALESLFGIQFLAADVYYISELPSKLVWLDVVQIAGTSLLLSLLATLYPAWQASRINPAEALRYE